MKKLIYLICFGVLAIPAAKSQIIRPFTARYYNASARGSIVYMANSIVSSAGVGTGTPGTGEVPPTGSTTNNGKAAINIDIDNPPATTKIPFGSVWNYHAQNAAPVNSPIGTDWKQPAYVMPATWNVGGNPVNGAGKYGYNATQTTCLPSAVTPCGVGAPCAPTTACNKYTAFYFRQTVVFTALELTTTYNVQLNVKRNDGIVIYINGVERAANNMPAGRIFTTLATANIAVGAAENFTFNLNPAFFTAGTNTIAVEVHTAAIQSADMSFDMEVLAYDDNGTFNSSSSDLNIPSCSNVLFAGLYWGTGQGTSGSNSTWITGETTCKLKLPGAGSYTTITSTQTDYWNNTLIAGYVHTGFQCFKDITSLVNAASPNGTYTVANVVSPLGINDSYGGWTIVIVYGNPSLTPRNLTVFDGCAAVKSGSGNVDVPINGFLTPASGPVSCELGTVVYDGDRGSGDGFQFKQNLAPTFYDMATVVVPLNGAADAWNSKISHRGTVVTTRNPAFQNTLGYDASIFDLPNTSNAQLSNSQTSAIVRFFSNNENVIVNVLTTSISQYNPSFTFDKTATDINGGSLVPGDSIRYQVNYNNLGNDSSTNTVIIDNIPLGTTFLPNSIRINGVAKTDGAGDDQAEFDFTNNRVVLRLGVGANAVTGGNIGPGVSGNIQFDVVTASSCKILACTGSLKNDARISYNGKRSGSILYDSSGVSIAGCIIKGPVITPISGTCFYPKDTLLINRCTNLTITLPWRKYAGYTFYAAMPFVPANVYNPFTPIAVSGVYWAYYNSGFGCSDTARIQVIITKCPDIDDDDDGIPDYVEFDDPLALVVVSGLPNWNRPSYPGYVDNNSDGVNDLFDWGADADNDGIPNFQDRDFWKPWVDINNDGVNDLSDKDLDGIPNQYDLDSDNDGIPDVVESYGVDTNGDGIIDNYVDTDNDGFSQNVDGNNTGVNLSGNGLGAQDFDGDGIPNYLDLDSDNDGIPDIIEALGVDANNDGKVDNFTDLNGDGLADNYFAASALLITGPDVAPVDGRADNYPNKNRDQDFRPNAYDLDSDGDGIVDVLEAGFPDADLNGIVDGARGTNGWATVISSRSSLGLQFTDADPYPDYLDIDSDGDGIPDNIEGQSTNGYKLPVVGDTDGDGIANTYDNIVGFGGSGILLYDHDGDNIPDYRDLDTDADGQPDIIEGNDFNMNGLADDNVTPTGLDTDGDGLDNRFDSLNSVTNIKGTSYRMGNGGTFTGDAAPGCRAPLTKKFPTDSDRAWRFVGGVLPVQFLNFTGSKQKDKVLLNWAIIAEKEVARFEVERSTDNSSFIKTVVVNQPVALHIQQNFSATDDISNASSNILYYRLKVIGKNGEIKYSNVLVIRSDYVNTDIVVSPNPSTDIVSIKFNAPKDGEAVVYLYDNAGKTVVTQKQKVSKGSNTIVLSDLNKFSTGVYEIKLSVAGESYTKKLMIWK